MDTKDQAKILNDLISTCRDSEEGFSKAAKAVRSDMVRSALVEIARVRSDFAGELQNRVRQLGAEPADLGHGGGILHRGWVDLEQQTRPKDDETLIEDCLAGEANTLQHYRRALGRGLPDDLVPVVERQAAAVEQTLEKLENIAAQLPA